MANNFVAGFANPVQWTPTNQAAQSLQVTGSSWDEEIMLLIVTHSGTGGLAARIPGVLDGHGTVNADYDSDLPPYLNPPRIIPGVNGIYGFFVTPVKVWACPTIIGKVHYETTVMGKVSYSFDIALNALAGSYVRPAS